MIHTLERFLEWGGVKKAVTCLVFSGIALLVSIFDLLPQLPFDAAWAAVVLCGIPIILEAVIGLVTAFDIKADVLVSIALIASLIIGEDFAAGEVAFIMQLGGLLEDLTVALVESRYRPKLAMGRRDLVVAALQRRGFAYAVVKEAIKRVEEE